MEEENRKGIFIKKKLLPKGGKMRKDQFVICILAGILLMIVAMPETKKEEGKTSEYRLSDNASGIIKDNSDGEEGIFSEEGMEIEKKDETEEYARYMENKLEQAISVMEGAGKVKVMITVSASKELVVEKDMPVTRSNTVENDSEGGSRNVNEYGSTEETVYSKESDGSACPYVVKTLQPVVEGVVVVAQGGDRQEVRKNITEAIVALFDIEPHKIKIVKMKSE